MKNKVTLPITCTSTYLDLYDIVDDDDVHGKRYIDRRKVKRNADASPCSDTSTDVPDDEEYLTEWDEWSEVEKGRGPKASWSGEVWSTLSGEISRFSLATPGESTMIKNGKCVSVKDVKNIATDDDEYIAFPTMPCTSASNQSHRTKISPGGLGSKLFNAMVSRPVGRAEIESNPKAKEAMLKEWKGLRDQEVFDFTMVREYDDVVAEAKKNKKEVHMARVHGICVEKNYQLSEDNPGRKFKGRGVLLGSQVKNQHWEAAFFQDLGNSPASFEASRWADFYGCLPGHSVKLADAIQAYIQAKLKGPLCWVELPTDAWPPEIQYWKFRRPVVRLDKALYGHPDSGTMWEQHCDKKVQEIGFKPIGEEWPSMYFHDELKLLLVIYVDDLKFAGPSENLTKGWEMLRTVLRIEPETDLGLYLGCVLSQGETQLHNGKKVKTITYNMEGLLKLSVEKYLDIIGKDTKLKKVSTPSLPEETKSSPYRAPSDGKRKVECPWCAHSFDPEMPVRSETGNSRPGQDSETLSRGNLAPHAASVLMKLLYAARIARFDLLRSINALARNVTKWTKDDDARLHHLMCYVNSTLYLKMIGWVGDKVEDLSLGLFADADFAGCAQSLRSTSGSHLQVQGKFTRFPLAGGSKRQGCVSHSTPEAEIVAADTALRTLGLPALSLWKVLAKVFPQLLFHDDNQGMIGVVRSGRNPTMRHLERTHGISIASMHEHFQKDHFVLIYEITAKMAADIHTKGFKNPMAWKKACMLINLLEPQDLQSKEVLDMLQPSTDVDMTTRQVFQSKTEDIPNFPYTETPILPKEVYRKGLTSKEKLQYLPGMDPIFVVKQPVFYRPKPPGLIVPPDVLRSTWVLLNGAWTKVEHRASPPEQAIRFDKWVERACFQYHSPNKQPLIPDTVSRSVSTTSTHRVMSSKHVHAPPAHSRSLRDSCASTPHDRVQHPTDSPILMFSVDALFLDAQTSPSQHPKSIHQCLQPATRVINTLMRLVHGGSEGEGWHSHSDKGHPQSTSTPGLCHKHPESDINDNIPHVKSTRKSQVLDKKNEDHWQWDGKETLIRIHKTPRRQNFVPQDCEDCPCDPRIICDERETEQKFKTNTRAIKDIWRFKGDNHESTNKLNDFWTGKSTFKVLANAEVIGGDKNCKVSQGVITLCTNCNDLNTVPITDVFVPYQYHIEVGKHEVDHPKVSVVLWREKKNRTLEFQFSKSPCDVMTSKFAKFSLAINLIEVPRAVPCFVLLCSEERNWFTFLQNKMKDEIKFHVVPITESYLAAMKHMVEIQMRHLGHALRYHNEQTPSNQIILQDVMKDVIAFETNQPRGRSAAQNHFLCLLALGTTLERHKTSARGDGNLSKIATLSEIQFSILKAFDIPQGILIGQGYNVSIADEGARYTQKERRRACHSSLKDFTTSMTETQAGTGGDMHNFDNWDVPLTFKDGRPPDEVDFWNNEEPSWVNDDTSTGPSAQSASSPPEGPQPQASQQSQSSNIQPKKMPRSSTGGGASSSTHAAFRSGPGATPQDHAEPERGENWIPTEDWMKRRKPSTVEVRLHAAEDYAHEEQRIAFLRSGRDFVLSTIDGPHTTHKYGTNLIWKQYLRRLTFHAALSFNMLTEGQLDSHMINESDYEWLKLYHHIITSTEFVRCKGYPVTEVLAMLTVGIEDTVEGEIRNKLKKLGNKVGQFIIGKPWMDRWDELGGQVRNNKALILTDLTYQTRSSSRVVNDIEAGLNNMGLSSIKVYQLPYESLEKPEEFLKLATNALTFLRTNTATFSSVTVHVWISFASLFRGQNRMLMPNADFIVKLAGIITEISQEAPLPIFVNILKDARFLGSQSSIVSIAEEFARILKEKGIIHSTNERFWKQIYACGREPFYWKEGEGKEVIWAMLEKSLMRQKVFLHCAMDHDTVHDLNEECVHVKNTGFDIETIKRCTEHPRIVPSIRTGDTRDVQAGSANIIGGMSHMKDSVQRKAWSDIRRGVFTPEPLTDVDEHWVEVTEDSELMCDVCKGFHQNDSRMSTCTENRTRCLNCASNCTRSAIYGTEAIGMDEFSQDARVAARLLNIYNECVDWRDMEAEKDPRGFLVTATLAMLSGYKTTSDVLKQVSHRGAIRMPAYMVKGKCRRDLLPQFTVQRETRTEECGGGTRRMRWFYRLLWDGGNVAYHDYIKTVLTKEEVESMFNPTATAEYIGDIFEFWLGMLDLGIQFPTMFGGWGANLDSCLAGLEESFWLYSSSCRLPTPSTRSETAPGKHTSRQSRTIW